MITFKKRIFIGPELVHCLVLSVREDKKNEKSGAFPDLLQLYMGGGDPKVLRIIWIISNALEH